MAQITQQMPTALPGQRYGSFAGKDEAVLAELGRPPYGMTLGGPLSVSLPGNLEVTLT